MSRARPGRNAELATLLKSLGRPLVWTLFYEGGRPLSPVLVDGVEVFSYRGHRSLGIVGTFLPDEQVWFVSDCAKTCSLARGRCWTSLDDGVLGIDFKTQWDIHRFTTSFDELADRARVERWLAHIATDAGRAALASVVADAFPEGRRVIARSVEWPISAAAPLRARPMAETDIDPLDPFCAQLPGLYYWAEETELQADRNWSRVRVWIYDTLGTVWLAFKDPALEDESRRMMGRTNWYGTTLENLEDYLSNWGGYQKSVSRFQSMWAQSVADVVAQTWHGATAVSGTSNEQALKELDPTGIGRHGKPRKAWGQK